MSKSEGCRFAGNIVVGGQEDGASLNADAENVGPNNVIDYNVFLKPGALNWWGVIAQDTVHSTTTEDPLLDSNGVPANVALVDQQGPPEAAGEKSRHIRWPLVPGWETIYGPEGCADARFKRTSRDALMLQSAVEQFREDGFTWYPVSPYWEINEAGRSVMDYMPRRGRVINAFTGLETGICSDSYSAYAGEICYMTITSWNGYSVGYVISAMGAESEEFLRVSHVDSSLFDGP